VVHVHEAEWPGPTYLKRLLLAPLKATDRVIANSAFTRTVLTALLPSLAERTVVVANPVRGPGQVRSARGRLDGPLRLLYVGRLSSRKGPDVAVAALGELVDRGVDVRLTLAGSVFPGYEWFEQQVRAQVAAAGLGERVLFLGFCPDTSALLAEADIVLVPSVRDESFGNSAVEGVLAARPTVVSDLAGLREAVDGCDSALVVPAGQPVAWADAVARIVADWPRFRAAALTNAARAEVRHAPEGYRERLGDIVLDHRLPRSRGDTVTPPGAPVRARSAR
jgi:glycosyltransferase involved in cell wall biosynthesis